MGDRECLSLYILRSCVSEMFLTNVRQVNARVEIETRCQDHDDSLKDVKVRTQEEQEQRFRLTC
jgi:hypothetical protein